MEIDFTISSFALPIEWSYVNAYAAHVCTFSTLSMKDLAISATVVKPDKLMHVCAWMSGKGTGIFNSFEIDWTVDIM